MENKTPNQIILAEYMRLGGKVFANVFMRFHADEETQRTIKASDFMASMMSGKISTKEWNLGDDPDFLMMAKYAKAINTKVLD